MLINFSFSIEYIKLQLNQSKTLIIQYNI